MGCGCSKLQCSCPEGQGPCLYGERDVPKVEDRALGVENCAGDAAWASAGSRVPDGEADAGEDDAGCDSARGKPGPNDSGRQRRRHGKAYRKAKNGVRNGFPGVPRQLGGGRKVSPADKARGPEVADRGLWTDGRWWSVDNKARWRSEAGAVGVEPMAPVGPKGGADSNGGVGGAPAALVVRPVSASSCEDFYTPTGSYDGAGAFDEIVRQREGGWSAEAAAQAAGASGGALSACGGSMSLRSPFEGADVPSLARDVWQFSDEDFSARMSGRRVSSLGGPPRRECSGLGPGKKSNVSENDWQLTSEDCVVELRSFSASAGHAPAPGPAEPGLVRSHSTNLSLCPERREELESKLQQLVFGEAVPPEVSQALRGAPLAKETSRLQLTNDETGAACINQYVIVRSLGQGSHGRVRVCLNALDGKLYAVKTINRAFVPSKLQQWGQPRNNKKSRRESADGILRELAVMKKLDHPNVVKLHEVIDPKGKENIVLITEFMEKGTLLKRLDGKNGSIVFNRMPEDRAREVFRSVCSGMDYLHYQGIVHGDLKPDNLLVAANGDVKIADFTCSRMVNPEHFTSGVYGTPAFHAPEVIAGDQYNPYAADIWALGVCIYCAVCGELPFTGPGIMSMYNKILACEVTYPKDLEVSSDMKDLIARIFVRDANDRIGMDELMRHPFFIIEGAPKLVSLRERTNPPSVIQVSVLEEDDAIDRMSAISFIRAKLKKKRYRKNDTLFKQGNPATCLYFVLDGTVALMESYPAQGLDEEMMESCSTSLVLDMDESFMMSKFPTPWEETAKEGVLHLQRHEVKALQKRRREAFLQGEQYEHVVAMRGPGQVVGAMEPGSAPTHPYTAVAQSTVTVLKLTEEDLQTAFRKENSRQSSKLSCDSSLRTCTTTPEGTDSGTGTIANGGTATATTSRDFPDHSTSQSSQV